MIARVGHARHEREAHLRKDVRRYWDIECLAEGCGFQELRRPAHPLQIGHQNVSSLELQQLKDALVVIRVLAGGDRDIDGGGNLGFRLRITPRNGLFVPADIELLDGARA